MDLLEFQTKALSVPFVIGGRDFNGWDCWGVIYCAYEFVFGDPIASYSNEYDKTLSYSEIDHLINDEKPTWIETDKPDVGDVGLYRVGRYQSHVSLVLPNKRMLHCEQRAGTISERLDSLIWARRNVGYFKRYR